MCSTVEISVRAPVSVVVFPACIPVRGGWRVQPEVMVTVVSLKFHGSPLGCEIYDQLATVCRIWVRNLPLFHGEVFDFRGICHC